MKNNKLLFVGDIYTDKKISLDNTITKLCADHSLCVFNLEGCFSAEKNKITKAGPHLLINPENMKEIFDNFNLAILANNHIMDYGPEGLISTTVYCKNKNCSYIGAGKNLDEAFTTFENDKYTIIAVAEHEFGGALNNCPGIATTENIRIIFEKIISAKKLNKKAIIVCHGGTELLSFPPPYIKEQYKLWIDYGADLIIGNHPHVAQGSEKYNGKTIFYSLGNFVFLRNNTQHNHESTWSIAVSYNYETDQIEIIPISFDASGKISTHDYLKFKSKIDKLNNQISSSMYDELYEKESIRLYDSWYKRLKPTTINDAALILHYFRCDAHRHFISKALSSKIGEYSKTLNNHKNPAVKEQTNYAQRSCKITDEAKQLMQMSLNEQEFLQNILNGKKLYLEIGSGYSTIYFSQFVDKMISVESRKNWFNNTMHMVQNLNIDNVTLILYEPEECAYDRDGNEKWTCRKNDLHKTDYGRPHEFTTYLQGIRNLCVTNLFDVVLVDGNVRSEVIQILIDINYQGIILLHDVLKEREYLNETILKNRNLLIINKCDSLVQIKNDIKKKDPETIQKKSNSRSGRPNKFQDG